ncbi:uncharacterized protein LOC107493715 [Arachis duranensis]|uniref:Uncharacterized protein LOC107493715 n=1 Tax=Arachis duranensis TaxID=130453 RepID=A0A6P4DLF2_ARADU|nr:uncharacterized protein LOC107493715 [Arachis duranensis]
MHLLPDPSLAAFDPEIKKTLSRIRRARRRLAFEGGEVVVANSPILSDSEFEPPFEKEISSSTTDSVDLRAGDMAEPKRITLQEAGAPDFTLQPYHVHHTNLALDFELKMSLINFIPKFHGLPTQEPIKHLRDFQTSCSSVRHHAADEITILLIAFPFSLKGKAREWYYTQPEAVVTNWDTLRREFLDKYFPAEVIDRLRKEISCIIGGRNCMKPQDKTTLDATDNGSLKKYTTATEVWQLIADLAESTRNARHWNYRKVVVEVSSSSETTVFIQAVCEMTKLLQQINLNQQQSQTPHHNIVNNWFLREYAGYATNTSKVGTITKVVKTTPTKAGEIIPTMAGGTTITEEAETTRNNQQQAPEITYPSSSNDELLHSLAQGQKTIESTLNGLTSAIQALVSQIGSSSTSNFQPVSSNGIPSQHLPNPKVGINAITLRSRTTLQERNQEEPRPKEHAPDADMVEVEDVEEEDEQVPKYVMFLKDLCIHKDNINELETIPLGSSISALMGDIPEKCSDSGPWMVNCTIGGVIFSNCMYDLGACMSIMPLSIYDALRLPPLKRSTARFMLADKSIITVVGIAEDVQMSIKGLTFPIDFYILEMPQMTQENRHPSCLEDHS